MTLVTMDESAEVEVDLASMTLEQLAERANAEHGLAEAALSKAMAHVFRVGEALYVARCRVGRSGWKDWQAAHLDISPAWTSAYMRAAVHRDRVVAAGATTLTEARKVTTGLPPIFPSAPVRYSDEMKREARQLATAGLTVKEIALALGIAKNTVHCYIDPEYERRHRETQRASQRRMYAARKALAEKEARAELDRLAKAKGAGPLLDSIRDAARSIDQHRVNTTDEERAAWQAAYLAITKVEEQIGRALRS